MLVKVSLHELHPLRHFLPSLVLFIPAIATSVYTALDKTLIGVITNSDFENGNYEYSERIVKMVLVITSSLGNVITPRNSRLFAEGDLDSVRNNINKSLRFTFFIGIPLTLGCISIADNLVPWYLGSGYEKSSTLIKLLAPIIIVIGLSNVFGRQLLIPGKRDKQYTYAIIGGAVINFGLNIVLIKTMQSYGAAIATVIAETAITVIMIVYSRRLIHINSISSWIWKYTISGVIMFVPCFLLSNIMAPTPLSTMLIIIVGCGVYFLFLFFTRDTFAYEMYYLVRDKIRAMLRKK
jgi:O-antigen/teichoic acid export membrane protein